MYYYIVERDEDANIVDDRLTNVRPVSILLDEPKGTEKDPITIPAGTGFYRYITQEEYEYLLKAFRITREDIQTDAKKTASIPTVERWKQMKKFDQTKFYFTQEYFVYRDEAKCRLALPALPLYRMQFYLMQDVRFAYSGEIHSTYKGKEMTVTEYYVEHGAYPEGILVCVNARKGFEHLL